MRFFSTLFTFFLTAALFGETLFVRPYDDSKPVTKALVKSCEIESIYKIKRSSFYAVHTKNSLKSATCLKALPMIDSVEADKKIDITFKSNDPYFKNQWHLQNTGQRGTAGNDARVAEAWEIIEELGLEPGKGVKIGIIDDAFDLHHPDMEGKFLKGYDLEDDDDYPYADENEPHGTCVSGVAAAVRDNKTGVAGGCPGCKIVPVRAGSSFGEGEKMALAFNFLLDRGVHIITNSWGPADNSGHVEMPEVLQEIIGHARKYDRDGLGVVIFFAAGNGNEDISADESFDGFAANENVIAVGAVNAYGIRSNYSDFGRDLDILSPSSDTDSDYLWNPFAIETTKDGIWTIDARSYFGYSSTDYTGFFGGTSSATPLAASIAALLIGAYPQLSRDELYEILTTTADKVSPNDAMYDENGFSEKYGYGRINAAAAVSELCKRHECTGGLPEIEEETYPAEELDYELTDSDMTEFPDDDLAPVKVKGDGCSTTFIDWRF
ncbi:S8 family serine peptidase [bacterium]|nr:S8 family serine peptidase [bacterium]MBR6245691.1 S8 family serine peptidase [bacterium]